MTTLIQLSEKKFGLWCLQYVKIQRHGTDAIESSICIFVVSYIFNLVTKFKGPVKQKSKCNL